MNHKGITLVVLIILSLGVMFALRNVWISDDANATYTTNCSSSNITIERISSPILYTDYPPGVTYELTSGYAGYKITNNSGVDFYDLWVQSETFTGTDIYLAQYEDGVFHPGGVQNGETVFAFFYITSNNPGSGNFTGDHDIVLYDTKPSLATGNICGETFSLTSENNIDAAANKVTSFVTGPTPPELGGKVTIDICGDTGTIGSALNFSSTPASYADWRADSYELRDVQLIFDKYDLVENPTGANIVVDDTLYINASSPQPPVKGYYCATYSFKATGTTATPTNISPVNHISSGTQVKHTNNTDDFINDPIAFPPILPATNTTILSNKSVSPFSFTSGGIATYSLIFTNTGSVNTSLDDIVDTIGTTPGVSLYVPGSANWGGLQINDPFLTGLNNEILTFIYDFQIPVGGIKVLTYDVAIPNNDGIYTNTAVAHVGLEQIDTTYDVSDNAPAVETVISGSANTVDLSIEKIDNIDPITSGEKLTYTVTVTNNGPSNSTGGVITDTLPGDVTYDFASSNPACLETALNSGFVECTFGTLTNTSSISFNIVVDVNPAFVGTLVNNAVVVGNEPDLVLTNNDTSDLAHPTGGQETLVVAVLLSTDLEISKTATPNPIIEGNTLTYYISITNNGPDSSSGGVITDILPTGLTYSDINSDIRCNEIPVSSGMITCTLGTLANTATTTFEIVANVDLGTSGIITNNASIVSNEADPSLSNNDTSDIGHPSGPVDVQVNSAQYDLKLSITQDPNPVSFNEPLIYTLNYTNFGVIPLTGVEIIETVPLNTTFDPSLSTLGWTCLPDFSAGSVCTFIVGSLDANTSGSVEFAVTVDDYALGSFDNIENSASIINDGAIVLDQDTANNTSSNSNTVVYSPQYSAPSSEKTFDSSEFPTMSWKMVWINNTNSTEFNVRVVDPLSADLSYISNTLSCIVNGSSITTLCSYDEVLDEVVWEGLMGPDLGLMNELDAINEVVITFDTLIAEDITEVSNQAYSYWDDNNSGGFDDDILVGQLATYSNDPGTSAENDPTAWVQTDSELADTGFKLTVVLLLPLTVFIGTVINRKRRSLLN